MSLSADDVAFAPIRSVRERLDRFELTSEDLVRGQLERAESISDLNAFISVLAEDALEEARHCDRMRRGGDILGPLHGIPITAKDIVWSKGRKTTSGSKVAADFVPDRDAPSLARLRAAGAVLLGKTNLHEFAYGVSNVNPHYGPARNPRDRSRVSGGSSGGSAVALASGVGYGSIGTDTGGSIRIPAALCGIVGLKPTYGRIPREGVTPLSWSLDHIGPMARTVEDVALLYEVMSGERVLSPSAARAARRVAEREAVGVGPHGTETVANERKSLDGLRLGKHTKYFFENLVPEVKKAIEGAISNLERLGARVVEIDIPEVEIQGACRNTITFAEASSYHAENIRSRPEDYGEDTRELLRMGLLIPATDYLSALRARRRIVRSFRKAFEDIDVLVAPTTPAPAPAIGAATLENGEELRSGLLRLVSPFNTVGFPAISLPCGATRAGLPIGVQLAAGPGGEATILRVARVLER